MTETPMRNGLDWLRSHQVLAVAGAVVLYMLTIAVYRLYLSPLAKFPGPKIAALTMWYNGYHDLGRGGQFVWVVEEMHRQYGPIVRTRPDALHVNDPMFIDKLYSQSPKHRRERYKTVIALLQAPGSILATKDHDMHRRRRAVLNPYFSQQNVRRLEAMINQTLATLLHRMDEWATIGEPVAMSTPFRAATNDIIQAYAFGEAPKYLEMPSMNADFFSVVTPQRVVHLGTHVLWLATLMANLPPAIMFRVIPRVGVFARFVQGLMVQIDTIRNAENLPEGRTIFHEIIRSDVPESEKATKRLSDEAMVLVIAGSETTANTMVCLLYHVLSDRQILKRLKAELETVMPTPNELPQAAKLDGLPFLRAVIEETIRLHPSATHRQDRVAPDEDLVYEAPDGTTHIIPAGTAVGMTASLINRSKMIYDRPDEFIPDRYIDNPKLFKYQFAFSKGTRQCIGINLAYQQLQTFTAGIFRKYDVYDPTKKEQTGPTMELYKTTIEDIQMYGDYITPGAYPGSHGLRIVLHH